MRRVWRAASVRAIRGLRSNCRPIHYNERDEASTLRQLTVVQNLFEELKPR